MGPLTCSDEGKEENSIIKSAGNTSFQKLYGRHDMGERSKDEDCEHNKSSDENFINKLTDSLGHMLDSKLMDSQCAMHLKVDQITETIK